MQIGHTISCGTGRNEPCTCGAVVAAARYCRDCGRLNTSMRWQDDGSHVSPQDCRLEIANFCGPDDARTVPMNTRVLHGPAERDGSPPRSAQYLREPLRTVGQAYDVATDTRDLWPR